MATTSDDLIAAIRDAVDLLTQLDPRDLDGRDAAREVTELHALTDRLTVLTAQRLPVVEADGWWAAEGARSLASWLSAAVRTTYPQASKLVQLGRALHRDLPATAEAALTGDVPLDHAHAMAKHAASSPERREALAAPDEECGEGFLVRHAKLMGAEPFARLVRRWSAAADPESDERGFRKASDREFLTLADTTNGTFVRGFLTHDNSAALRAALEAVMTVPAPDDLRTTPQRRAHALVDLARLTLDHGIVGTSAAVRPQISCVIDYESLLRALGENQARPGEQLPVWTWPEGDRSAGPERRTDGQTDAGSLNGGPSADARARREPEGDLARVVAELAGSELMGREPTGREPTGPPARVEKPPGHEPLRSGPGTTPAEAGADQSRLRRARLHPVSDIERFAVGEIVGTGPVPDHVLARLACDSEITRVVFGPQSQVINAGRSERTFSGPRRRAIIARDGTCRYPGCGVPPALGEIHHVDHWARDHGDSDANRGVLLCWHHHALVHRVGIEITRTPTGGWRFTTKAGTAVAAAA